MKNFPQSIQTRILLLFASVVIFSAAAVLAGEFLINKIYFEEPIIFDGGWFPLTYNILILCCVTLFILAVTNRLLLSILLVLFSYSFLIAVDITKLVYLGSPARPADFQYLEDLRVVARSYLHIGTVLGIIAACALALVLGVFLWKRAKPSLPFKGRIWTGVFAAVALTACFALPQFASVLGWLTTHGMEHPIVTQFEPRASARNNGLLADWAISAAEEGMQRPDRYSRSEIDRIARAYQRDALSSQHSRPEQPINLIMYVIESFMDPMDLGIRYTSDPVPTFHAISRNNSSGRIVVPVFGGASANTEFELLTGLSMYFLPSSSCPYRQSISRDIPSLPRALHQNGYRTMAIVADPPYLFNRTAVFGHLGFDSWLFPATDPNVPRSPSPEFAADDAIADAIITASRGSSPYFIYAFPSGSHFPWDYDDYLDSKLDLVDPMPKEYHDRLKTYINALNVVDQSLKKLIDHFSKSDQRTAIFVMGDHMPALAEVYDQTKFFNVLGTAKIQKRYSVPAAIWCNWPAAKEDFNFSANFTAVRLMQVLGVKPTGSLALNAEVRSHFSVLSQFITTANGRLLLPHADDLPFKSLLEDYSTIQYDLLEGKRYSLAYPGW